MYNSAITITHEIVHQWAGDCTSPKWWNSIWLNEGFALIMPYIILNEEFPNWHIMTNYHIWETKAALEADSNPITHPICCEANSQEEIPCLEHSTRCQRKHFEKTNKKPSEDKADRAECSSRVW